MDNHSVLIKQIIGKTIKALRMKRDFSQEDLAGIHEVDRAYISKIESGRSEPSVYKIFELCEALQIKPSDFIKLVEIEYERLRGEGTK